MERIVLKVKFLKIVLNNNKNNDKNNFKNYQKIKKTYVIKMVVSLF